MTFKIGDKVRVITEECCYGWPAGAEGEIVEVDPPNQPYRVKSLSGGEWWQCEDCLELISQEKTVTIPVAEYNKLQKRGMFLSALEAAGVDNWSGYSHAYEILEEWNNE